MMEKFGISKILVAMTTGNQAFKLVKLIKAVLRWPKFPKNDKSCRLEIYHASSYRVYLCFKWNNFFRFTANMDQGDVNFAVQEIAFFLNFGRL